MSDTAQNKKVFKFGFSSFVETVTLALKFPCVVSVLWKRGQKVSEVKQRKEIEKGVVTFNQQLEIECNMIFDLTTQVFDEKKTKFTVLIFSEKGNKQAGEVVLDVAQFLNLKLKEQRLEKSLEKCPDKNAKLTFVLKGYLKEEIEADTISQKSNKTYDMDAIINAPNEVPNFKKKKDSSVDKSVSLDKSKKLAERQIPPAPKVSIERTKLLEQNQKLTQQMNQLKQLQLQNENLRRKYTQGDKKTTSYYTKKLQEAKSAYQRIKQKVKHVQALLKHKEALTSELCECKQRMGKILNYAISQGNSRLIEEIYDLYQMNG